MTTLDGIPVVDAPTSAELDALRRRVDPLGDPTPRVRPEP